MSSLEQVIRASRRQARIFAAAPVKVFLNPASTESEWSCTYEIWHNGVRLKAVPGADCVGKEIWIQRNMRKAKYRIIWIGASDSPLAGQFGAECIDGKSIWDDEL